MAILLSATGTTVGSRARSEKPGNTRLVKRRNTAVVVQTRRVFIKWLILENTNMQALAPCGLPGDVAGSRGSSHGDAA